MPLVVKQKDPEAVRQIQAGTYRARLVGIKQFTNAYGERVGFEFQVEGGPFDGCTVMRSTAPQLTRQSKLTEVIEGIQGRPLTDKELMSGFDLEDLLDSSCNILVLQQRSKTGAVYSNVERVFKAS